MPVDHLVTTEWLEQHLCDPNLRVIDCRGYVTTKQVAPGVEEAVYLGAVREYQAEHIPGAVYVDWTQDIIDPDDPVPVQIARPDRFAEIMGLRGVGDETYVIAVDHMGGQFATRLWWALKYYGHDTVSVLDGGWNRWVEEERSTDSVVVVATASQFTPRIRAELRSDAEDVRKVLGSGDVQILDARDSAQFQATKRRGPRGGHIPGAVHVPREGFFAEGGGFLPLEEVRKRLERQGIRPDQPVIAYCNGGVAATVVLFNLDRVGKHDWSNYDGSWNEWSSRADLPIEPLPSLQTDFVE